MFLARAGRLKLLGEIIEGGDDEEGEGEEREEEGKKEKE